MTTSTMGSASTRQHRMNVSAAMTDSSWQSLYSVGAAAALSSVLLVLLDIVVSLWLPHGEVAPGTRSAIDWFTLFQDNRYYGFRDLGVLNIFNIVLGIPLLLALYAAHRRVNPASAALAVVLFLFGGAVYIANNPVLPLFVLSEHYAAATTDAQRSVFAAAGEALLARGADFTLGSLVGLLVPAIAQIAMSGVLLHGGIFSRATGYIGMVGFAVLLIFTLWTTFDPESLDAAMVVGLPGGLLVMAWNVLVARRLYQLGRAS